MYLCITNKLKIYINMLRIKEIMKSKGLTTVQLAEIMNLSRETVSRQINDSNMTISTLQKYADVLSVSINDLFINNQVNETKIVCPHCNNEIKLTTK